MRRRLSKFLNKHKPGGGSQDSPPSSQPSQSQPKSEPSRIQETMPQRHEEAQAPLQATKAAAAGSGLTLALQNQTSSSTVYASITGLAIDHGNSWFLLESDGRTPYYPTQPSGIMSPLQANVAIPLGAPGNTIQVTIPHIAGGRIWFSIDQPITFHLNPGPALVEPSVTNPSDANNNLQWGFCEFTYNADQLYANISYVDFVGLPISLQLDTVNSGTQYVSGMGPGGIQQVADGLRQQNAKDHVGWDQLIVNHKGTNTPLRILSPNQGMVGNPNLFANYYNGYVEQVFNKYSSTKLQIDTQAGYGTLAGEVTNDTIAIGGSTFARPTTKEIFSCDGGPFQTGQNQERNAIVPRLAAAYNRSTFLKTNEFPASSNFYYQEAITNHYSRIVHAANLDGKGYAFPYDDVQPTGGPDQSGEVHAGDPKLFTIAVGGNAAKAH